MDRAQVSKLQWAVRNQDLCSMRQLLSSDKMLMNAVDYDQRTPLHVAALFDCQSAARILLMQVRGRLFSEGNYTQCAVHPNGKPLT